MNDQTLTVDIQRAIDTFRSVQERVSELEAENKRLSTVIANMREVLGLRPSKIIESDVPPSDVPTWKKIEMAMKNLGGHNTINQLNDELKRIGIDDIARDTIRTAMMRRPQVFRRVSEGVYDFVINFDHGD